MAVVGHRCAGRIGGRLADSREIVDALPPEIGQLEVMEGAGCFPWLDIPDRCWSLIIAFVTRATPGGGARHGLMSPCLQASPIPPTAPTYLSGGAEATCCSTKPTPMTLPRLAEGSPHQSFVFAVVAADRGNRRRLFASYQLFGAVLGNLTRFAVRPRACVELLSELITYTRPPADIAQR